VRDATTTNLMGFFYAMNYTTKTTVNYPIIEIEVLKNGKHVTSRQCHIGQFERFGVNHSFLDHIRVNSKWGYPNCIHEIEESVKPYLDKWHNES
jgi:hypothetical protein